METFAAGIIPIKITDQIYFLLGLETSNNKWSGFVGSSEPGETIQQTAIREFNEESCMIFKDIPITLDKFLVEKTSKGKNAYLYFVRFENLPHEIILNKSLEQNKKIYTKREYQEKKKLHWFSLTEIKKSNKILNKLKKTILNFFF